MENLAEGLRWLEQVGRDLKAGRELDKHYIGSRYPNFHPVGYTPEEFEKMRASRNQFVEEILKGRVIYGKL